MVISYGFDSWLVLGPLRVKGEAETVGGFDPLLSDSVTLCSQQGHQRPVLSMGHCI